VARPFTGDVSQIDAIPDTHQPWDQHLINYGVAIVPEKGLAMQRNESQRKEQES
jgi:hypothetical protein